MDIPVVRFRYLFSPDDAYAGLGDRHQQNGVNYTLDLNTGLTQVLSDGTNTYLYGNGRIAQTSSTTEYFLGDALGSVRQLADSAGAVTLTQSYAPYGEAVSSVGSGTSVYQFTGESRDSNGLTYLRARYLDSSVGRFTQRDPSGLEANLYLYAGANPVNYTDPSGLFSTLEIAYTIKNGSYTNFLNSMETTSRANIFPKPYPKWGLVAALRQAQSGDRVSSYRLVLPTNNTSPYLEKMRSGQLGFDAMSGIELDGMPVSFLFPPWRHPQTGLEGGISGWRDVSSRYYYLDHNGSNSRYVDGANTTDYPDFHSISYFDAGLLGKLLSQGQYKGCIGLGGSLSFIVDRFGNRYVALGVSGGVDMALGSYVEGYVASSAHSAIFNRSRNQITDSDTMRRSIEGVSGGVSASVGMGRSASGGLWWPGIGTGAGILTYSIGAQAGASYDLVFTRYIDTKPSLGWNWAFEDQYNGWNRSNVE